jgi:hypothetical protein
MSEQEKQPASNEIVTSVVLPVEVKAPKDKPVEQNLSEGQGWTVLHLVQRTCRASAAAEARTKDIGRDGENDTN